VVPHCAHCLCWRGASHQRKVVESADPQLQSSITGGICGNIRFHQTRQDVQATNYLGNNPLHGVVSRRRGGSALRIQLESTCDRDASVVDCREPRNWNGTTHCSLIEGTRLASGWNTYWQSAVRGPWKVGRYSGLPPIACITRTPIEKATPILPMMEASGPTWAGF
jgi:hypothetical protein